MYLLSYYCEIIEMPVSTDYGVLHTFDGTFLMSLMVYDIITLLQVLHVLVREFTGIHNVVTNLMRATNYLGYFVALGF